ncbi:transglycosylase domain-containing protein [Odoribacter laneus]|uniref:transglycosylase domain-containing protein n=1 Tax=Odoribacter laneus TaxID=626933 RepID=UPI003C6E022B
MFKKYKKFFFFFWGIFLIGMVTVVIFFWLITAGKLGFMPTFEELENPTNKFASEIYFEDGPMISRYYQGSENRRYTEYRDIPESVKDALIATEDIRFYEHSGIDVIGLFRVAKGLLTGNSSSGGGSTITQQLAKMLFPRDPDQNFIELSMRKFREWVIAVRLEKSYTKEEIITMYLNKFDFLNLAVGINSAADVYFQKPLDSLKIEEAAMLVGMAKNPALFNPLRRPEKTLGRRNVVLSQMLKYDKITQNQYDSLKMLPLGLKFKKEDHKEGYATYFREYLRIFMTASPPNKSNYRWNPELYKQDSLAWEHNPLYGWCKKNTKLDGSHYDIYSDGLKIYTTLNSHMQKYAEEAVVEHLSQDLQPLFSREKIEKRNPPFSNDLSSEEVYEILDRSIKRTERYRVLKEEGMSFTDIRKEFNKSVPMQIFTWQGIRDTIMSPLDSIKHYKAFFRAGFMVMEPQTGNVKAYVGGPDYRYFMYDMVSVGRRQVGSTIKPILYTLAMQEGLGPCDQVPNIPQTFVLPDGTTWTARGGGKRQGEMVSLRWGLANSENNISGWVLKQFTPEAVAQMAHKMGIQSFIDPVPSVFLGTAEISVKEMVAAYSIFANKGVYNTPLLVSRIEDKYGNTLVEFQPDSREVITAQTAYLMCNLLEGVVNEGTGIRLRYKYGFTNPMGGKTGTTQQHADGWFMAITPNLVGGVWVGAEDRSIHFQNLVNGQGASMALPIWAKFLKKVMDDPALHFMATPFEKPIGVLKNLDCAETTTENEMKERINQEEDYEEFY